MENLLYTKNISDGDYFIRLADVAKKDGETARTLLPDAKGKHISLYICVVAKTNPTEKEKTKYVPLKRDEIDRLYANGKIEIDIPLDRFVGLYANLGDAPEEILPLEFEKAPIVSRRIIKPSEIQMRKHDIEKLSAPMPIQLKITSECWRDVFSRGLDPTKQPKSRKKYALDYLETNHPYIDIPQRERLAIIATGNASGTKITEPVTTLQRHNNIDHELYSRELAAAFDIWLNGMSADSSTEIENEYVEKIWPGLSGEAIKRIKFIITT